MESNDTQNESLPPRKIVITAAALALLLAGCGASGETLTLSARGDGSVATVRYVTPEGEVEEEVELPWDLDVDFPNGADIILTVTNASTEGEVFCALEGRVGPALATGEAEAWCQMMNQGGGTFVGSSDAIPFDIIEGYEPRPALYAWTAG